MTDHFATYQKSAKNLRDNPHSEIDRFIVDMWAASKKLANDNVALKQELADTEKRAADHFRKIDRLESQVARLQGADAVWVMPKFTTA